MPENPKVGLALSGGAARGLAHIGVLKALEEESIPIDMISGTSAGALVGACYAKEKNAKALEELALGIDWRKLAHLIDLNLILLWKGFVQGQKVKSFLSSIIGDVKFKDLAIPLAVVAADVDSMEEIIIKEDSVIEAVRASIPQPVIFTPVKWKNRFLIDGGVVNPLPADVVRNMGAEVVIAVNTLGVGRQSKDNKPVKGENNPPSTIHPENAHLLAIKKRIDNLLRQNKDKTRILSDIRDLAQTKIYSGVGKIDPQTPNIFDALMQSIHAMEYEIVRLTAKSADIVINPDVGRIGTFGFYRGEEAISQGYKATKDILPQLRKMIHCP
jgi:NTE family protein